MRSSFCGLWTHNDKRVGRGGTQCPSVAASFAMTTVPEGVRWLFSRPGGAEQLSQSDTHLRGAAATCRPASSAVVFENPRQLPRPETISP
jgi:hypothetical protein